MVTLSDIDCLYLAWSCVWLLCLLSSLVWKLIIYFTWCQMWLLRLVSNCLLYLVLNVVTLSGVGCGYSIWYPMWVFCLDSNVVTLSGVQSGYFSVWDVVTLLGVRCVYFV